MVFDVYFDKSLWLMITGNKQSSERVLNFVISLPKDFYKKIRESVRKYREYKYDELSDTNRKNVCFYGETETNDGYLYSFNIDTNDDTLKIGEYVLINGIYVNNMDITLYSFKRNNNLDNFDSHMVGRVCYDYSKVINRQLYIDTEHIEIEYSLMKTPIGSMLIEKDSDRVVKKRMRKVKVRNIPYNYGVDNLNKLIRDKN